MSMPVRSMLIRKSIGRSDTREPGAYAGVWLGACSAARSLGKEAVGADLADEAHAVVELERRVTEPGWLRLVQLGVHRPDELLVLGRPLWLDLVANNDLLHFRKPPRID